MDAGCHPVSRLAHHAHQVRRVRTKRAERSNRLGRDATIGGFEVRPYIVSVSKRITLRLHVGLSLEISDTDLASAKAVTMTDSMHESQTEANDGNDDNELNLSIVRDDVIFRAQRRLGLIAGPGMNTLRRALLFAAVTWLPVAVWALFTGRALHGTAHDSLAAHFGLHVRCLIAIPMMIMAEGVAHKAVPELLRSFVDTGIVTADSIAEFRIRVASVARLRKLALPWIVIVGSVIAWSAVGLLIRYPDDISWTASESFENLPFGGWWFLIVIRPLFTMLVLAWLWRGFLIFVLLWKIVHMQLSLVPSHPDRAGGLSFVERLSFVFSPVVFAISATGAAAFAHDVVYHGMDPAAIKVLLLSSVVLISLTFLLPFLPLSVVLARLKRHAILEYGILVDVHDRLVHQRWIQGEDVGHPDILDSPELGPVADIHAVYDAVANIRATPVGKMAIAAVVIPALLPMLYVFGMQMPLTSILGKIVKTLI